MNKLLLFHLTAALIIISSCSSTDTFQFDLPSTADWEDVTVRYMRSADNIKLAYREIGPANGKRGLVFVPGSTMYGYYYIPHLKELSKYNILVRVVDIRGHGDSEGARGDVPSENSLIEDLSAHVKDMRSKNPHMDIFIGGHSMGAGVCGRYLEHYGYDAVKGAVYISPFFHYDQSGMKNPGYVDVNILTIVFGGDHAVSQIYHPGSDDPKLVKKYTNIMSRASMVSDYSDFRIAHTTDAILIIGKNDELFDWNKTVHIFNNKNTRYILLDNTGHMNFKIVSIKELGRWINEH